jgi:hypothetical protein
VSSPTVECVPLTREGAGRLAAELDRVHQPIDPPALVWVFDAERLTEVRGALYGWRRDAPRHALVVWHEPGPVDRVMWVCEPFVRRRRE